MVNSPSLLKPKAVLNYLEPKSMKDLQSFVGLTSYFRIANQNYSLIAKPLTYLLRKNTKFQLNFVVDLVTNNEIS